MATNGNLNHQEQYTAPSAPAEAVSSAAAGNNNLSKDEVGWYFVEQYYTTLSKTPEKLHVSFLGPSVTCPWLTRLQLFYGKRSQFVYGQEAEVASVAVGRQVCIRNNVSPRVTGVAVF